MLRGSSIPPYFPLGHLKRYFGYHPLTLLLGGTQTALKALTFIQAVTIMIVTVTMTAPNEWLGKTTETGSHLAEQT